MSSLQIEYDNIFNAFLGNVTDYKMASLSESDADQLMVEYLHKVLAETNIKRLFSTSKLDDNIHMLTIELKHVGSDETSEDEMEFIVGLLSKGMVVEWIAPQLNKSSLLAQMISNNKDAKFFSQSNHITALRAIYDSAQADIRREISDRGYILNEYLETST